MEKVRRTNDKKNWIAGAISKPGALRKKLKAKKGKKLSKTMLKSKAKGNTKTAKQARLALLFAKWRSEGKVRGYKKK